MSNINPTALGNALLAMAVGQKHDVTTTTQTTNYMHGAGGIFGVPGAERELISVRLSISGILRNIPARPTNVTDPIVPYLTGFTSGSGDEPVGVCDEPPTAGDLKNAFLTAQLGRVARQTATISLERLGEIINRAEMSDFAFINDNGVGEGNPFVPDTSKLTTAQVLNNEILARLIAVGVDFEEVLSKMVYTGNPANNTASGGYMEFPGLEILVGTGKVDALTNTAVPSLDSIVRDFNFAAVDSNSPNIVNVLTYLYRVVRNTASRSRMGEVQWAFVMRESLFYELTAVWPTNFMTYRHLGEWFTGTEARLNVSADAAVEMRNAMRRGQYLEVDGFQVPVLLDDAIPEECGDEGEACFNANLADGQFASDIYLLPLSVRGGSYPVLFAEYFNFSGPGAAMDVIESGNIVRNLFWTDSGRYLWNARHTDACLQWVGRIRPRLRLLTPHLAARLQNVMYSPYLHERDAFRDDPYFVNGGLTTRTSYAASYYNEWD